MANNGDKDLFFRICAIERLVTWLAAQEVSRTGDVQAGLQRLSNELHSLLDESPAPNETLRDMQEHVSAQVDDLIQSVSHEVARSKSLPRHR